MSAVIEEPAVVLAHGIGGREDLPLPFDLVLQGAAVALLVSFLGLGLLWRTPRFRGGAAGRPLPVWLQRAVDGAGLRWLLRLLALVAAGYVAVAAIFGPNDALNPAPYAVYVLFWVGLVPASLLFGPVWRVINPLRTVHRLVAAVARVPADRGLLELPAWVGYWPAALSLLSFVWLELAVPNGDSTTVLVVYFTLYAGVHLIAALLFGDHWFQRGDGFEVYSTLIGTLAPVGRRDDGRLVVRNPLDGAASFGLAPGIVAVVAVLLGSTFFDSVSGAPTWTRLTQGLSVPEVLVTTPGLLVMIGLIAVTFTAATLLAGRLAHRGRAPVPRLMAHTVIPIIVGYLVAHYFSFLVFQGQQAFILLSDPLGNGANILGTALRGVDYSLLSPAAIAGVQVVAVVAGHILGVVAAHDRAVALFPRHQALSGQLPLLVLMITYTVGGLTLLFAA
ncbi:MAG: hypothetical protein GEV03_27015 [Streptosporangiales bacterium]|nr:hypothetical protein [Streptosporangiales bacterium]